MAEMVPVPSSGTSPAGTGSAGIVGTTAAVVAGINGGSADGAVVDWAADAAHRFGVPLRFVSIVDAGVQMTPYEVLASGSPSLEDRLRADLRPVLDQAAARALARHAALDIAVSAPLDNPAAALVRLSERAELLVVGGPDRGRIHGAMLGSVAMPVVAHARCPVVVVPAGTTVSFPQRIIVGVDGSEAGGRAVEFALRTAEVCGGTVTGVLAWNVEVEEGVVVTEGPSRHWAAVEERYETLGHRVVDPLGRHHPLVDVHILVRHGAPAKALLQAAAELEADLLVVGSRGRGGFRGLLLGSVSRSVVEHADRVIAVVH
jgi:nucleotide-binding universal stress UspA family protein